MKLHLSSVWRRAAIGLSMALAAGLAGAQTAYYSQYTVTTDLASPPITLITMIESTGQFGFDVADSITRPFTASGYGATTQLNNPFDFELPVQRSLLVGIVQDLPGDAAGQEHLVLMMDTQAASNVAGIAWGTIFTEVLEEDILFAVRRIAEAPYEGAEYNSAIGTMFSFGAYAASDAKAGPNGLPASVWFDTGGDFSVVAWSSGQIIGSGTSEVIAVVPEPGTAALWLAGLGVVALRGRRLALLRREA